MLASTAPYQTQSPRQHPARQHECCAPPPIKLNPSVNIRPDSTNVANVVCATIQPGESIRGKSVWPSSHTHQPEGFCRALGADDLWLRQQEEIIGLDLAIIEGLQLGLGQAPNA